MAASLVTDTPPRFRSLAKQHAQRVPQPSDIIASSFTSPIDALYLAAIFDPIFTASYPHNRQLQKITLFGAIMRAFSVPQEHPPPNVRLTTIRDLLRENPNRVIVVFPECTTTNGRGILPFSPSLLSAPAGSKIFPVSLRYTPGDVTTAAPGLYWTFLWNILSKPTHCIRVRIAEVVYNVSSTSSSKLDGMSVCGEIEGVATGTETSTSANGRLGSVMTIEEKKVLEKVGEALARLGRVKRVGLGVKEKVEYVEVWKASQRR